MAGVGWNRLGARLGGDEGVPLPANDREELNFGVLIAGVRILEMGHPPEQVQIPSHACLVVSLGKIMVLSVYVHMGVL